jgi:hemerythrin superfamily protein
MPTMSTEETEIEAEPESAGADIFSLLKKDHDEVKQLFQQLEQLEDGDVEECARLVSEIRNNLLAHAKAEAQVVYTRLLQSDDEELQSEIRKAHEEHDLVEQLLGDIGSMDAEDEQYEAKVEVLKELVEHHIEEEEGTVFDLAKNEVEGEEAEEIAVLFLAVKDQLLGEMMESEDEEVSFADV